PESCQGVSMCWRMSSHPLAAQLDRRDAQEWRCVTERTRIQRIKLQCQDGSTRTYKITAVTSCTCKRYTRQNNDPSKDHPLQNPKKKKSKTKKLNSKNE
ncbi:hypothetical protein M9458_037874, partial [Cirrhinus mrigala]